MKVKVNGKKLVPNSAVLMRFMGPLLLWAVAVVVVFGVSFGELSNLQGPLSSLNAAGHVTYRVSRVRLMGNFLAFASTNAENAQHRANLLAELATLRSEYNALLYGGRIEPVNPAVKFEAVAPPATFASAEFARLFFTTRDCLREDPAGCAAPGSPYYDITHAGLDAMVTRCVCVWGGGVVAVFFLWGWHQQQQQWLTHAFSYHPLPPPQNKKTTAGWTRTPRLRGCPTTSRLPTTRCTSLSTTWAGATWSKGSTRRPTSLRVRPSLWAFVWALLLFALPLCSEHALIHQPPSPPPNNKQHQGYTIQRFEAVKTLHIILLVASLATIAGFVVLLFRPYVRLLHEESKDIAGLLSQLPAEVAIEDIARTVVIVRGFLFRGV
jgi:hypothetical protein